MDLLSKGIFVCCGQINDICTILGKTITLAALVGNLKSNIDDGKCQITQTTNSVPSIIVYCLKYFMVNQVKKGYYSS